MVLLRDEKCCIECSEKVGIERFDVGRNRDPNSTVGVWEIYGLWKRLPPLPVSNKVERK